MRRLVGQVAALVKNLPLGLDQAGNGAERGRFAGAVAADERDDLARTDFE